jgi:precorrin-2 dehydrogenase / sirohydrochlorin ferrochelatase
VAERRDYPIFVDMTARPCLVVGGGVVAERKVEGLLEARARVTVVSPTLTARLEAWARADLIRHVPRPYRPPDLAGQAFVFVATDSAEVTAGVSRDAADRRVLVNAADDPDHSDFILPSVLRRGALVVAVATGGASPALARAIREELESYFTDDYTVLARIAAEVRGELRARGRAASGAEWRRALAGLRPLIVAGRHAAARRLLLERLEAARCA